MKVYKFLALIFFIGQIANAQSYKISYNTIDNYKESPSANTAYFKDDKFYSFSDKKNSFSVIDFEKNASFSVLEYLNSRYASVYDLINQYQVLSTQKGEDILGFKTFKASYSSFSNNIEIWYTKHNKIKGSLSPNFMPQDVLVLKMLINGSRGWVVKSIEKSKFDHSGYIIEDFILVDDAQFREIQIKSRYQQISIFSNQQLNWGDSIVNPSDIENNRVYRFAGGTVVFKKIKIPEHLRKNKIVFAELVNYSLGDAYDRTGSVIVIPSLANGKKTLMDAYFNGLDHLPVIRDNQDRAYQGIVSDVNYDVPIELMRFFTSFGVRHFNNQRPINNYNWADSVVYKQDISDVFPFDAEELWIGAMIGNYDRGGHNISLNLNFYPSWNNSERKKLVKPLIYTINSLEMFGQSACRIFESDTLEVNFQLENDLDKAQLVFTSTGHGGWGGGDEFNPKKNQILLDGNNIFNVIPWRTDCANYRLSNPASGNFENGLSSSDLSRSNWCPASLTPPYIVNLGKLGKGKHHIRVVIDQGMPEGGSYSAWNVSLSLTGFEE